MIYASCSATSALPHWDNPSPARRLARFLIHLHQSNYRHFCLEHVMTYPNDKFPGLVSDNQFVEPMPSVIMSAGITFIYPTTLAVCKNPVSHAGLTRRSNTSTGTLIVNNRGELLDFMLIPGHMKPIPKLTLLRRQYRGRDEINSFS